MVRRSRKSLLIAGALAAATAIAAATINLTTPTVPAMGEVRPVNSGRDIVLPFDEYRPSTRDVNAMERAAAILATECMHRFGLDWHASGSDVADPRMDAGSGRYGIIDQAEASRRGYHPPEEQPREETDERTPPSLEILMVYTGKGASTTHGLPIPEGGCLGEGRRKLAEGAPVSMSGAEFAALDQQLFSAAQADSRVGAAMAQWRDCMARSGYDYTDVWAANNDVRWTSESPTATEIATAKADVACRKTSNLVAIWLAVETAYQRDVIGKRVDDFTAIKESMRMRLDNALRVISTH